MLKRKKVTFLSVFLIISLLVFQGSILAQEANDDYQNYPITQQTHVFVAEFNAKATADSVDGVLGLSNGVPADYSDYNILLLFNNTGFITAKNADNYEAINELPYTTNTTYVFKQLVNISAQTYSLWVTPEGGSETLIAEDFAFSAPTDTLNYRSVKMSFGKGGGAVGAVEVTDFTTKNSDDFINTAIDPQTGVFVVEFNAKSTADSVDGLLALSKTKPAVYDDLNVRLLFNRNGFITAKNGGTYESINDLQYTANTTYAVRQVVDIPNQTFGVWVTPQNGGAAKQAADEVLIAEDFAFTSTADTLNYLTVKMGIGGKWGGAEGVVKVTDFTISDAPDDDKLSCVLVTTSYPDRKIWDDPLVAHLEKSCNITKVMDITIGNGDFSIEELKQHDFCVVSETVSDYKLAGAPAGFFKTAPIPMLTDNWFTQSYIFGWLSSKGVCGTISDSTGDGGKVRIVDDTNHPLSAGFAYDTEMELVTATDEEDELGMLTYCIPEIDYIPIAVWAGDPKRLVVGGVEAGTPLWNDSGLAIDPNLVNENRIAAVGLYRRAFPYITEAGYKLLDAAIAWILDTGTAVEHEIVKPVAYSLAQNYPNPFNPTTTISFELKKSAHTTLTVHNVLGQVVATLIDDEMAVGAHHVSFEAKNIPSGVYFYRLQSGKFNHTRKMMLMK